MCTYLYAVFEESGEKSEECGKHKETILLNQGHGGTKEIRVLIVAIKEFALLSAEG